MNQCLEMFPRSFISACPKKWKEWLLAAEFWYNTCSHSALGRSPFEALYGRQPIVLGLEPLAAAQGALADWLVERASMNRLIRDHLLRAQARMKTQADKSRSES
jgi:hypothetical protein